MIRVLILLTLAAAISGIRYSNVNSQCEFTKDCRSNGGCSNLAARDDSNCPYRGCPCFITPPVNPPNTCPRCLLPPCPCLETCPILQCPKDCEPEGWITDERGCNTCRCKRDCEFHARCEATTLCRLRLDSVGCPLENCLCDNGCLEVKCENPCTTGNVFVNGCKTCQCNPIGFVPRPTPGGLEIPTTTSSTCSFDCSDPALCTRFGVQVDGVNCPLQGCPCNPPVVTVDPNICPFPNACAAVTCLGGFQTDSNNCALRGCPCAGNDCDESFRCDLTCPLAFENGCPVCRCECGPPCIPLSGPCQFGAVKDANGCNTCECLPAPAAPTSVPGEIAVCPFNNPPLYFGWKRCDDNSDCAGIQICCSNPRSPTTGTRCTNPQARCPSSLGNIVIGPNCPRDQCTRDDQCKPGSLCCGGCPRQCVAGELPTPTPPTVGPIY